MRSKHPIDADKSVWFEIAELLTFFLMLWQWGLIGRWTPPSWTASELIQPVNHTHEQQFQSYSPGVKYNLWNFEGVFLNIWPEETELPGTLVRFLKHPSRTVRCRAWWLLLPSQFQIDGKSSFGFIHRTWEDYLVLILKTEEICA